MQIFIFWWGQFQVVSIFVGLTAICESALWIRQSFARSLEPPRMFLCCHCHPVPCYAMPCHATLEIMLLQLCKIKFKLALSQISLVRINVFGHNMLRIPLCIKRIIFSMIERDREEERKRGREIDTEMPHRKFSIFQ